MLALDARDANLIEAVQELAPRLKFESVVVAHVYAMDPFPAWMPSSLQGKRPTAEPPEQLELAVQMLKEGLNNVDVVGVHAVGDPAEELARIATQEDIDLLIIGRNPSVGGEPGWGPSGRKLLQAGGVSTLVVPVGSRLDFDRVVCGVDFSHTSRLALSLASQLADELTAVYQYSHAAVGKEAHSEAEFDAEVERNARAHFDDHVRPELREGVQAHLRLVEGGSPSQVLTQAAGNGVIVVGSRGLTKFAARLLGSTAETLAGVSVGPVLIVRRKGESLGLIEGLVHR